MQWTELEGWYEEALATEAVSPVTVKLYSGVLRSGLATAGDVYDVQNVEDVHAGLTLQSAHVFRAAWRKLDGYLRQTGQPGLPTLTSRVPAGGGGRKGSNRTPFPHTVVAVIPDLFNEFELDLVFRTTWGDVALLSGQGVVFYLPGKVKVGKSRESWLAYSTLRAWASENREGPGKDIPLVPVRPDSRVPASRGLLRQIHREGRKKSGGRSE